VLRDHRRALAYSAALLVATAVLFAIVGADPRHPLIQPLDDRWYAAMNDLRSPAATFVAKVLDLLGGVYVTLPIRIGVAVWLIVRRRWRAFATWVLAWALSEITVTMVKAWFDRPRPPGQLVPTSGSSFPSGHATAVAATAVALVLVLLPEGSKRRKWEASAIIITFFMSLSRTYLNAHWFSDVLAGSLLGAGIAILSAGISTEVRDIVVRRQKRKAPPEEPPRGPPAEPRAPDEQPRTTPGVTPTAPG
jgi:membrane-associated phospholipid phosphatase